VKVLERAEFLFVFLFIYFFYFIFIFIFCATSFLYPFVLLKYFHGENGKKENGLPHYVFSLRGAFALDA